MQTHTSKLKLSTVLLSSAIALSSTLAQAATLTITTNTSTDSQTGAQPHIAFRGCKGTYRTQFTSSPSQGDVSSFDYDEATYGTLKQVTISITSADAWKMKDVTLDGLSVLPAITSMSTDPNDFGSSVQSKTFDIDADASCTDIPYCVNVAGSWFYNRDEGEFLYTYTEKNGRPVYRRTDGERWLWFSNGQWKIWKPSGGTYWWQAKWTGGQAYNPIDSHSNINACSAKQSVLYMHGGGDLQGYITNQFKLETQTADGQGDLAYINTAASTAINSSQTFDPKFSQIEFFHDRPDTFDFASFAAKLAYTNPLANSNEQFRAQGVYLRGGSQTKLKDAYVNTTLNDQVFTPAQLAFLNLKEYGIPMLGVSAGTAFFSDPTNSGNHQIRGMGAAPGLIVDQHFMARNRHDRLVAAVEKYPDLIGLGVDENSTVRLIDDTTVLVMEDPNSNCVAGEEYSSGCYGKGVEVIYNGGQSSVIFPPGSQFDLRDYSPYLAETFAP